MTDAGLDERLVRALRGILAQEGHAKTCMLLDDHDECLGCQIIAVLDEGCEPEDVGLYAGE